MKSAWFCALFLQGNVSALGRKRAQDGADVLSSDPLRGGEKSCQLTVSALHSRPPSRRLATTISAAAETPPHARSRA